MGHLYSYSSPQECKTTGNSSDYKMTENSSPQFLILQLVGTEKTFYNVNPFYIQKNLDSIVGKVKNTSCLRNCTLLVEVSNKK
jgi:hypothetical protein